ncbi:hypothetical protein DBR11_28875 [Pedobacter sp. HMWF019]|uniref:hypothetical protein n=1 Tax=Pedobacter sp. HMWF019 TaxID=2056856 RepID=UPI000D39CA3C|nr:hypothetical protein [Pedobacter sp. HMWF019]PTS91542.1 hypothetical protein DBR11_28875 [Pedobacter sp. HMWF019]
MNNSIDTLNNHVAECIQLKEVLEEVLKVGVPLDFYRNVEEAFHLLIANRPNQAVNTFETYSQLTSLFRVMERNKDAVEAMIAEINSTILTFEEKYWDQ